MSNLNKAILVGRVSSEIELKYTTEGSALAKFTLTVERPKRSDGVESSDIINIVSWSKLAEICAEYLKPGRLILIDGRIQVRSYEDNNGKRKYSTEVIAQTMKMLEGLSARYETQPTTISESEIVRSPIKTTINQSYQEPVEQVVTPKAYSPEQVPVSQVGSLYTEDDIPF